MNQMPPMPAAAPMTAPAGDPIQGLLDQALALAAGNDPLLEILTQLKMALSPPAGPMSGEAALAMPGMEGMF